MSVKVIYINSQSRSVGVSYVLTNNKIANK